MQSHEFNMKTYSAKPQEVDQSWLLVDAEGLTLGRMAQAIATRLRGKHKPEYTAHVDTGDFVVVINADKVKVTGNKAKGKIYYSHSGFPGGLKSMSFEKLQAREPEKIVKLAVKGMLPRTPLGRAMFKKLKVYAGSDHPHEAQQPASVNL
jgi:large subunit ribosomal protein L13|tara:strand:+ start:225 stop:674 length:450 start_codon:yes stop_codon:yes gene_type:complete